MQVWHAWILSMRELLNHCGRGGVVFAMGAACLLANAEGRSAEAAPPAKDGPAPPAADRRPFHDPPNWTARYSAKPITVDGRLDEPVWKMCETYAMRVPGDRSSKGQKLHEGGRVRLAWDESHLYLAIDFDDSDVVAFGTKDHEFHFLKGDLAELFVKRPELEEYWELYVTPAGRKTCIHFPRSGGKLAFDPKCELKVAAHVDGTLNDAGHADRGWTAEMSVPVAALKFPDSKLAAGRELRVLVGRYNYASGKSKLPGLADDPELSSAPDLSISSFHVLKQYAHLKLVK